MPQMGESIAEGTVSKWLKKVGDMVERDEPILEISTDKVDAEIPAPQAGVLLGPQRPRDLVVVLRGAGGDDLTAGPDHQGLGGRGRRVDPDDVAHRGAVSASQAAPGSSQGVIHHRSLIRATSPGTSPPTDSSSAKPWPTYNFAT